MKTIIIPSFVYESFLNVLSSYSSNEGIMKSFYFDIDEKEGMLVSLIKEDKKHYIKLFIGNMTSSQDEFIVKKQYDLDINVFEYYFDDITVVIKQFNENNIMKVIHDKLYYEGTEEERVDISIHDLVISVTYNTLINDKVNVNVIKNGTLLHVYQIDFKEMRRLYATLNEGAEESN